MCEVDSPSCREVPLVEFTCAEMCVLPSYACGTPVDGIVTECMEIESGIPEWQGAELNAQSADFWGEWEIAGLVVLIIGSLSFIGSLSYVLHKKYKIRFPYKPLATSEGTNVNAVSSGSKARSKPVSILLIPSAASTA